MAKEQYFDEVTIFGGKLRFLIPKEWDEGGVESKGEYMYCVPGTRSGWFRASLVTTQLGTGSSAEWVERHTETQGGAQVEPRTGSHFQHYEKGTTEEGDPIRIYYWIVWNAAGPHVARQAIFSFTVLSELVDDEATADTVNMLRQFIPRAEFCADEEPTHVN
jgi:hypothetical protein